MLTAAFVLIIVGTVLLTVGACGYSGGAFAAFLAGLAALVLAAVFVGICAF